MLITDYPATLGPVLLCTKAFSGLYFTLAYLVHLFLLSPHSHLSVFHLYAVAERALRRPSNSMRLVDTHYCVKEL